MATEQKLREALENLANVFHEGRAVPLDESSAGYVNSAVEAAERTLAQSEQSNEADELLRNLGLDPDRYRTEAGFINHLKVKAAIKYPDQYPQLKQAEVAKPDSLSDFIRSDDSTRAAIGARVVDAAVETQRAVMVKPETERAELLKVIDAFEKANKANYLESFEFDQWFGKLRKAAALLSADSKDAREPVPADCDVRKIMLDVVPGWDGMGQEVYAKSVREVEDLLSGMGQRLEDFELGITRPQAADAQPSSWDQESRGMFVARLEKMQENGIVGLTIMEALALLNDCDMLATQSAEAHGITGKGNAS